MRHKQLEQVKTINVQGHRIDVVRCHDLHNAWIDRDTLYKVRRQRRRELAEIKDGISRLRGLLQDID